MEKYIINGQGFDVDPQDLEAFLKMYPGAKKYEPGKTIDSTTMDPIGESNIMGSNLATGSLEQPDLSFTEKLSNIFEPVVPQFVNMGEQFAQSGIIALDNMFKTVLPKGGALSNLVEKTAKKLMIKPEEAADFDASTLVDQLLYITGDYDKDLKLFKDLTGEEKETMEKIAKGEIDVVGKVIAEQQEIIDKRLEGKGGYTGEGFFDSSAEDKVLAGVGAMVGVVSTVVPAILTKGKSLGPQIALPMISEYNNEKAKFLYGEEDPDALRKLGEEDGYEFSTPAVLGYAAYQLEKLGFKGITNYMFKQSFKPGRFVKLLQTGNINGVQEALQGLVNKLNITNILYIKINVELLTKKEHCLYV